MKTQVYRNLINGLISVRQNDLVVCHAEFVTLENPSFTVREKGRQWVIANKEKIVHAFVNGSLVTIGDNSSFKGRQPQFGNKLWKIVRDGVKVKYNPYRFGYFFVEDGQPVGDDFKYISVFCDGSMYAV